MSERMRIFVGTYTEAIRFGTGELFQGKGEGIHSFTVDPQTGELSEESITRGVKNPSYLCFDPTRRYLYAVNELKSHESGEGGTVSSFAVGDGGSSLTFLNKQPTRGTDPCHVATDSAGRHAMVTNFMSGSVSVYPIRDDGSLAEASDFSQHAGSSAHPERQSGPHAHSSVFDASGRFVFVPDLGLDRVVAYRFDSNAGTIASVEQGGVTTRAGAGPRHLAFSPDGAFAYVINELDSTIVACRYDAAGGSFAPFQTVSTLPEGFSGDSSCADIAVHPSGAFLYASNRGHDSIVTYHRDSQSGTLALAGHVSSGGSVPRNFALDPSGTLLLVANQATDTIVPYRIDADSGEPKPTGRVTKIGTPVCVKFFA